MRKTTNRHGLLGAVLIGVGVATGMLVLALALLVGYFKGSTDTIEAGMVIFTALIYLAVAGGVSAALIQRWREVKGGEEDEARKY